MNSLAGRLRRLDIGQCAFVITTPTIMRIWGRKLRGALDRGDIEAVFQRVADTEESKSAGACFRVISKLASYGRTRGVFIIAFGGGVVGDLSGFVASVYKRGIPYVQLPTTLLAQVDSAIGGKVAIDLPVGKNLIGSFYQPRLVFSDASFLRTLPLGEVKNGLAEVIKYGVIKDEKLFEFLEDNAEAALALEKRAVEFMVRRSSQLKARIVGEDEFDKLGARAALNYGHTIGHAIEAASGYSGDYGHGMSVAIGMAAANFISRELGLLSDSGYWRVEALLKKVGLPTRAKGVSQNKIYNAHLYDKKFAHGRNKFILPLRIGAVKIAEDVPEKIVRKAITFICGGKQRSGNA